MVQGVAALIWRVLGVAQKRFRHLDPPELLTDMHAGHLFADGQPVAREALRVAA